MVIDDADFCMRRRTVVAGICSALGAGCTSFTLGSDDVDYSRLEITRVRSDEVERRYIDGEYVQIENLSNGAIELEGVALQFSPTHKHVIEDLELVSGAQLFVLSRSTSPSKLDSDPPVHVRGAGFGDDPKTSVLEAPGTVELHSPNGNLVDKYYY
ncbi:hypothetical protein GCM10028857_03760 [Salinarchaeum chitinilyticum]